MSHQNPNELKVAGIIIVISFIAFVTHLATSETPEERDARIQKGLDKEAQTSNQYASVDAFFICRDAIRRTSRDPATAQIPQVGPMKGGADWRFLWSLERNPVRLHNGLGVDVPVSAVCVVDENTKRIKLLAVDGQQIISPGK